MNCCKEIGRSDPPGDRPRTYQTGGLARPSRQWSIYLSAVFEFTLTQKGKEVAYGRQSQIKDQRQGTAMVGVYLT